MYRDAFSRLVKYFRLNGLKDLRLRLGNYGSFEKAGTTAKKAAESGNQGATFRVSINGNANSELGISRLIGFIPF